MDKHDKLDAQTFRRRFIYNPETGEFIRLQQTTGKPAKRKCGGLHELGYVTIGIFGSTFYAHQLAWLYVHGEWPEGELDHINGNRSDNRLANLRPADRQLNMQNLRSKRKTANPTSQYLGVSRDKRMRSRPWRAVVNKDGKNYDCGYWKTEEEAHAAYVTRKRELHAGCTL